LLYTYVWPLDLDHAEYVGFLRSIEQALLRRV
jgi:hypothetical protein